MKFHGADYDPSLDAKRLEKQNERIWQLMGDHEWRTLSEIASITGDPEASISAQLRCFRRASWGGHHVDRRRRGDPKAGLFEYRLRFADAPQAVQLDLI